MTLPEVSAEERARILAGALASREPLRLKVLPSKVRKKAVVLEVVSALFAPGRIYAQPEVNALLEGVYADPVTLRRDLIDFHFLRRTPDGGSYWREGTGAGS